MTGAESNGRPNQKTRTRKDLLQAAARLMKQGRHPTLEEVAEEALVSRATAYRYFPSMEALMVEAAVDVAVPEPSVLFRERIAAIRWRACRRSRQSHRLNPRQRAPAPHDARAYHPARPFRPTAMARCRGGRTDASR